MTYHPRQRISAEEALRHTWINKHSQKEFIMTPDIRNYLENLRSFNKPLTSLQKAALTYMAGHVIAKEEEIKLRDAFTMLDRNADGQLTEEELIEAYKYLTDGNEEKAREDVKDTMKSIDINNNGNIDYNGINVKNNKNNRILNCKFKPNRVHKQRAKIQDSL